MRFIETPKTREPKALSKCFKRCRAEALGERPKSKRLHLHFFGVRDTMTIMLKRSAEAAIRGLRLRTYAALVLLGCSEHVTQVPSAPTKGTYQIAFPSTIAAVGADTVQVMVFDPSEREASCLSLVTKIKSNADLPKSPSRITQTEQVPLCSILADGVDGGAGAGKLGDVAYGRRAFLALTRRGPTTYFIGCVEANIASQAFVIDIPVLPVDTTVVPPASACAALSDKCANRCQ
jgi:hypothetical protein